jgi:ubiquitin-activating enzyme E1
MVYSFFMPQKKLAERLDVPLTQVLETISKKPLDPHVTCLILEMCVNDRDGEDVEVPPVCLHLRG